ncbi:MAG: adenosylcobinamide-GDP ribazoletransferase [Acidimicrobiales bacterium]
MTREGDNGLRQAVAFLTPVGGAVPPGPEAFFWFPAVGAVLGLVVGAVWWTATRLWDPAIGAVLAVVADLAVTGMLHFDGVCDAADGLLPPLDRARRLAVMASPEIGAFGLATGIVVLGLRGACLAAVAPSPVLLAGLWAFSRTAMVAIAVGLPYARPGGLAAGFLPRGGRAVLVPVVAAGTAAALLLAIVWRPLVGPLAVVGAGAAVAAVAALARHRIGGFTGDVLGAAGVLAETAGLLVGCARW